MEGLLLLIAAFLGLPVFIGITALIELIVSLVSLLLQLFVEGASHAGTPDKKHRITIPPRVLKWIQRGTLALISFTLITLLLINFVFLDSVVRYAAGKAEEKTGISVDYASMEGNLFTGKFGFTDVSVIQRNEESARFDIQAESIQADLTVLGLLVGKRTIESSFISNAKIQFETPKKKENSKDDNRSGIGISFQIGSKEENAVSVTTDRLKKIPRYQISHLALSNVAIDITDQSTGTEIRYPVHIDQFESKPLRSHYLWFDILFRSNIQATLADSELLVENSETNDRRHTHWGIKEIDAPILASLVGGPFKLFEAGRIDVEVTDQWEIDNRHDIQMDWNIKVKDAQAKMHESTPTLLQPLTKVLINNINSSDKDWDFGFQLTLSEDQFEGASSLNAKQVWQDAIPVMLKQATEFTGIEADTIKETTRKAFDAFKGFLRDNEEESQ